MMNLALLHKMSAGGVPFNFVKTYSYYIQEFMKKYRLQDSKSEAYVEPLPC